MHESSAYLATHDDADQRMDLRDSLVVRRIPASAALISRSLRTPERFATIFDRRALATHSYVARVKIYLLKQKSVAPQNTLAPLKPQMPQRLCRI